MGSTRTVKLVEPFDIEGETTDALTIRTPKAADFLAVEKFSKLEQARSIEMVRRLTGLSRRGVEELCEVDIERVERAVDSIKAEQKKRAGELDEGN